jgi:pilus assembly protein CpaF
MVSSSPREEKTNSRTPIIAQAPISLDNPLPAILAQTNGHTALKDHLFEQLILAFSPDRLEKTGELQVRQELARIAHDISEHNPDLVESQDQEAVIQEIVDDVYGYGPIEVLMRDHEISEILINGPRQVFIEKRGQLQSTGITFQDDGHLGKIIRRMISRTGSRLCRQHLPSPD